MSPTTVSTGIPQSLDIIQHLSAEVVLDLHFRQRRCEFEHLLVGELADLGRRVDIEAGHEPGGVLRTNAEEGLEGLLYMGEKKRRLVCNSGFPVVDANGRVRICLP